MRPVQRLLFVTIIGGFALTAADVPLEKLIPKEKWQDTGIARLTG